MSRVVFNYLRMFATFSIGLYIVKRLITTDDALFAVYTLVTVGLSIGVMLREALRAALVAYMNGENATADEIKLRFDEAVTIAIAIALLNFAFALLITTSTKFLNIDDNYRNTFSLFLVLRAAGASASVAIVPYLNFLAFRRRMGLYNIWLVWERVADLISVEVLVHSLINDQSHALLYGGAIYGLLMVTSAPLLVFICSRMDDIVSHYSPRPPNRQRRKEIVRNLGGASVLVVTMAMYFRFSLVAVNALFGEAMGIAYALSAQISSYLRQAVMGLVVGLDSYYLKGARHRSRENTVMQLRKQTMLNSIALTCILVVIFALLPTLLRWLDPSISANRGVTLQLTTLFIVGVFFRSLSEPWMQMLGAKGRIADYSLPLLYVAGLSPITTLCIHWLGLQTPHIWLGICFACSMLVSHCILVPKILARQFSDISTLDLARSAYACIFFVAILAIVLSALWVPGHLINS